MSVPYAIISIYKQRKQDTMSALSYSPSDLLVGKFYSSASRPLSGIIQEAKHAPELFYANAEAYKVRVRPTYDGKTFAEDFWATVCVSAD
jgi:hypothetical protein